LRRDSMFVSDIEIYLPQKAYRENGVGRVKQGRTPEFLYFRILGCVPVFTLPTPFF